MTDRRNEDIPPIDDRMLHDIGCEKEILGMMLLDPKIVPRMAMKLRPEDFYSSPHRTLYEHILEVYAGGHVPIRVLVHRLRTRGLLEQVGGMPYLSECLESIGTSYCADPVADHLVDLSRKRRLSLAATVAALHTTTSTPAEVATELSAAVQEALSRGSTALSDPHAGALEAAEYAMELNAAEGRILPTGIASYDASYSGLHAGEITVIAARTGAGKSSMACQIAAHNANRLRTVVYFSFEETPAAIRLRMGSTRSGVGIGRVRRGGLSDQHRRALLEEMNHISTWPLWVCNDAKSTDDIRARCVEVQSRAITNKIDLVVVDYLQLIRVNGTRDSRAEQLAEVMRELRFLASDLGAPMLAIAQLNRQVMQSGERPGLHHLKDSGAIEQDAAVVMLLHVTDSEENGLTPVQVDVAKHRHGPRSTFMLDWRGATTEFLCRSNRQEEF